MSIQNALGGTVANIADAKLKSDELRFAENQERAKAMDQYVAGLDEVRAKGASDIYNAGLELEKAKLGVKDAKNNLKESERPNADFIGPMPATAESQLALEEAKSLKKEKQSIYNQMFVLANERVKGYKASYANQRLLKFANGEMTYQQMVKEQVADRLAATNIPNSEFTKKGEKIK